MNDQCGCLRCLRERDERIGGQAVETCRMIVCATCGNKRCPHATDHRQACTNDNSPGQHGSWYGSPPLDMPPTPPPFKPEPTPPADPHGLPTEPAWLARLAEARGTWTYQMSSFEANTIARYVRQLREAAWPIVRALEDVGDQTNWSIGDETDRVYPWYEIEPLKHAVLGTRKEGT